MLQPQSRGCGSRQEVPENSFTFQQGAGKPGLTDDASLFRDPKIIPILSSFQSMSLFHGIVVLLQCFTNRSLPVFPWRLKGRFSLFRVTFFFLFNFCNSHFMVFEKIEGAEIVSPCKLVKADRNPVVIWEGQKRPSQGRWCLESNH